MASNRFLSPVILLTLLFAAHAGAQGSGDVTVITRDGRRTLPVSTFEDQPMVSLDALARLVGATVRPGAENGAQVSGDGTLARLTDGNSFVSVAGQLVLLSSPTKRVGGDWFVPLDFMSKVLPSLAAQAVTYRDTERSLILGDEFPRLSVRVAHEPAYTRIEVTTSEEVPIELSRHPGRVLLTLQAPLLQTDFQDEELLDGVVERIRLEHDERSYQLAVELGERFFELKAFEADPPEHGVVLNLLRSRVPTRTGIVEREEPETIEEDLRSVEEREGEGTNLEGAEEGAEAGEEEVQEVAESRGREYETINLPPDFGGGGAGSRDPLTNLDQGPAQLRIVAIDPGHGGEETGAEGRGGLVEKEVVLSIARRLRQLLQERMGLRVILTRDGDRNLDLDERAALANSNKADLFISIHADSSPRPEARGSSVYFLSYTSAREQTRGVSMARGRSAASSAGNLDFILWDMAQASHLNQSSTLAEIFQEELIEASGAEKINRGIKQNTFRVLKGATMPAVLVEVGFISNPEEEALLATEAHQEKLAEALYRGVLRFKDIYEYEPRAERAFRGRK